MDSTARSNRSSSICATKIEAFQVAYSVDAPILYAISLGKGMKCVIDRDFGGTID